MSRSRYIRRRVSQDWRYLGKVPPEEQTLELFLLALANHDEGNLEEVAELFAHFDLYRDDPEFWFRVFKESPSNIVHIPQRFHRGWMLIPAAKEWGISQFFEHGFFNLSCLTLKDWYAFLKKFPDSIRCIPDMIWEDPDPETWAKLLVEVPLTVCFFPQDVELPLDTWVSALKEDEDNIILEYIPDEIWENTLFQFLTMDCIEWDNMEFYSFCREKELDPTTRKARRAFKYPESPGIPGPRRIVL